MHINRRASDDNDIDSFKQNCIDKVRLSRRSKSLATSRSQSPDGTKKSSATELRPLNLQGDSMKSCMFSFPIPTQRKWTLVVEPSCTLKQKPANIETENTKNQIAQNISYTPNTRSIFGLLQESNSSSFRNQSFFDSDQLTSCSWIFVKNESINHPHKAAPQQKNSFRNPNYGKRPTIRTKKSPHSQSGTTLKQRIQVLEEEYNTTTSKQDFDHQRSNEFFMDEITEEYMHIDSCIEKVRIPPIYDKAYSRIEDREAAQILYSISMLSCNP
jgi:hypothetical protein